MEKKKDRKSQITALIDTEIENVSLKNRMLFIMVY